MIVDIVRKFTMYAIGCVNNAVAVANWRELVVKTVGEDTDCTGDL